MKKRRTKTTPMSMVLPWLPVLLVGALVAANLWLRPAAPVYVCQPAMNALVCQPMEK